MDSAPIVLQEVKRQLAILSGLIYPPSNLPSLPSDGTLKLSDEGNDYRLSLVSLEKILLGKLCSCFHIVHEQGRTGGSGLVLCILIARARSHEHYLCLDHTFFSLSFKALLILR